jgi:glutamate decarboxylase
MRVVVRESLSLDMIDHLVTDICAVTETLMKSDTMNLETLQPWRTSIEKAHSSRGLLAKDRHKARQPMSKGVHRSVC